MKTRAVRLHGAEDLRINEFELPETPEILARGSTRFARSAAKLATAHKRGRPILPRILSSWDMSSAASLCGLG